MQTRLNYYVRTATGGHVKLGTVVTTKDCRVPGVVLEVGRLLGVDGWNCYEVNGKMVVDGPGIPYESVFDFVVTVYCIMVALFYSLSPSDCSILDYKG